MTNEATERVRKDWDSQADKWYEHREALYAASRPVHVWMLNQLAPSEGQRVLEIAAGPGDTGFLVAPFLGGGRLVSTDLSPSMTLGCGSWGGNVTSDNVSPIHLLDIKRVAFETKPVNTAKAPTKPASKSAIPSQTRRPVKREEIAAIVDSFLSKKLAETPPPQPVAEKSAAKPEPEVQQSPVRTIIHELRPPSENGAKPVPLDFVSEDDVRRAIQEGKKVYITAKTILTPSARDLGDEKDIFARI